MFRRAPTPNLAYASFRVMELAGEGQARLTNGIYFHKAMSLLHRRLGRGASAIHLPHCWYFYGDEVVRSAMPHSVFWDHSDETLTRVGWRGSGTFPDVPGPSKYEIDSQAEEIIREFPPDREKVTAIIDAVYTYAPFPFQQSFRKVKGEFYDIAGSRVVFENAAPLLLAPTVSTTLKSFPSNDPVFQPPASFVDAVDSATEILLESNAGQRPAYRLLIDFWEFFCFHLRTHPRAHEETPGETLQFWEDQLGARRFDYLGLLGRTLSDLKKDFPNLGSSDDINDLTSDSCAADSEFRELLKDPALEG